MQIRNVDLACPEDVVLEREDVVAAGLPSRLRRSFVIVLYVLLLLAVFGEVNAIVLTRTCLPEGVCTASERTIGDIVAVSWLIGIVLCIVLGWRGRLPGARINVAAAGAQSA